MSKHNVYQQIRRRCKLIMTSRSNDYEWRTEYWKHDNVQYTVLLHVTPCTDRVIRILGCFIN